MIDNASYRAITDIDNDDHRLHLPALFVLAATLIAASVALHFSLLLAGTGTIALFVLTMWDLSIGVLAVLGSVPIQSAGSLELGGASLTWTKLAMIATVAAWLVRLLAGASHLRADGPTIAFGGYVLVLVASIVVVRDVGAWAGEVYRWSAALLMYVIAAEAFRTTLRIRATLVVVAGSVAIMSVVGWWQVIVGAGPRTFAVDGMSRAFGTFGEPNPFAGYLEMTVLLLVPIVLRFVDDWRRGGQLIGVGPIATIVIAVVSVAGILTVLATQSRGGYLGFASGLALAVWLTGGNVRWLGTVAAGAGLILVLASPLSGRFTERLRMDSIAATGGQVTSANFAAQERSAHWRAALRMAEMSPILGVGAGNYNEHFRESTQVWRFRIPRGHAHNAYLQALAQSGVLGLETYLALLATVVLRIRRSLSEPAVGPQRTVVVGVAAVTLAVMVHNTVEYLHVLSLGLQLSIVWALLEARADDIVGQPVTAVTAG